MDNSEDKLSAEQHDVEGTRCFDKGNFEKAAFHYGKALIVGHYKRHPNEQSIRNLHWMYNKDLIDQSSEIYQFIREQQSEYSHFREATHKNGALVFAGVFFGYLILVYAGGITGFLRDFSLPIGGGLAYGAWKLATAALNE